MKKLLSGIFIFLVFFTFFVSAQKNYNQKEITVVFYNCENFFDTINNPNTQDDEFLPEHKKNWNTQKYHKKIEHISKVISSIDSLAFPAIIGLSEIENSRVVGDLVNSRHLKKAAYKYVHFESSDIRGIDLVLLYDPKIIDVVCSRKVQVIFDGNKLREILYVKTVLNKSDTLNIFINHWKSRSGGVAETEPKRIQYAKTLSKLVDSLYKHDTFPSIILMGDFNDEPGDKSLMQYLKALSPVDKPAKGSLYNLFFPHYLNRQGSYYFTVDKKWNMLDQFIVSGDLLMQPIEKLHIKPGSAEIFQKKWMLYPDKTGQWPPSKTYDGGKYYGGYSDHLPVLIKLVY
ncbi:MAG: endonuclease [Bacteroidales bacterium]|jgi:predicted extracellular nuclease|nr:endonuclease [Bacteroidales bacterium]MDD4214690.1 endonuclease [Bacteroidales bacterium]